MQNAKLRVDKHAAAVPVRKFYDAICWIYKAVASSMVAMLRMNVQCKANARSMCNALALLLGREQALHLAHEILQMERLR